MQENRWKAVLREKLPVWTPQAIDSFVVTTMSSAAKPPLKLLALGRFMFFALSTGPLANEYLPDRWRWYPGTFRTAYHQGNYAQADGRREREA